MKIPLPLIAVARRLGPLKERVVFVGGMIRGLLVTDPAAGPPRPTDDVDMIVDVSSLGDYHEFGEQLRELGFSEDMEEGAPICRWVVDGVRADVMPIDPAVLGFSNVWYEGAMDHAAVTNTPEGPVRHLDAPFFCATKLEAYASRGGGDLLHHDLEDVVALVDERASLREDIAKAPEDLRLFIAGMVSGLLASEAFREALPGHLQGDVASQGRLPLLLARFEAIAALGADADRLSPPFVFSVPETPIPPTPMRRPAGVGVPYATAAAPLDRVLLRSSNLRSAAYDATTNTLTIEFHGGRAYGYASVPPTIYEGLLRAYSHGRYFHRWIRNRYPYRRL